MAIVERRQLNLSMYNTTQIVAMIEGLDPDYSGTIRTVVWTCYKGSSDSGEVVDTFTTVLENGKDGYDEVFSDLTPNTLYYITALISNIQGLNGEVLYYGSQKTAISGGSEFPDSKKPYIDLFTAEQSEPGEKKIVYEFFVSGLLLEANDNYSFVSIYLNGKMIANFTSSRHYIDKNWFSFAGEITVDAFGIYEVMLEAGNEYASGTGKYIEQTLFVEVTDVELTKISLKYICEDTNYSYDGRVLGVIKNNIKISAMDWNAFIDGINILKAKVGGIDSNLHVLAGQEFTASLWNNVVYAVWFLYDKCNETRPKNVVEVNSRQRIDASIIDSVNNALEYIASMIT